jgi:ABC-type phosphate/phosphonate transport system substrate-binding protein
MHDLHDNERIFVSLPMYDWPELQSAWDVFWHHVMNRLRGSGINSPDRMQRNANFKDDWTDPRLLLGQACGWPFVSRLSNHVVPIARFDFGLPEAKPGHYHSVFIRQKGRSYPESNQIETLLAQNCVQIAINDEDSQSGFRAFGELLAQPITIPRTCVLVTGSHRASIRAVALGEADIAAIDAVTWRFALAHEPLANQVEVIGRSRTVPGLPLITAQNFQPWRYSIARSLTRAVVDMPSREREMLDLHGIVPADASDYTILTKPPFGNLQIEPE